MAVRRNAACSLNPLTVLPRVMHSMPLLQYCIREREREREREKLTQVVVKRQSYVVSCTQSTPSTASSQ